MKTTIRTYEQFNHLTCEYETKHGEFVSTKALLKTAKESDYQLVYRKAVDWTQPNYYVIGGVVWEESTYWKNTMLVGCGECRKVSSAAEFEDDSVLRNYWKNSI